MIQASRVHAALRPDLPGRTGTTRLVDHDEALRVFPRIYDRVRRRTAGFVSRTKAWWELQASSTTGPSAAVAPAS